MVFANLRETSRSFLRKSSRLRIFFSRSEREKRAFFSWADLYLPIIVPDHFFLEFVFCIHISRVLLKQHYPRSLIYSSATSVVNTERDRLSVFTTYPISHHRSLTTKVSNIHYPACLPYLTLPYPTHGKHTTCLGYIYPAYFTPLQTATPYFT